MKSLEQFIEALKNKQSLLLLALGDSNTDNTGFTGGAKQWPELLHTRLKQHYQTLRLLCLNAGISGDTVQKILARFETDVARFKPDCCILCIGSNDANQLTDEAFRIGLQEIISRLQAMDTLVILRTPTPIWERGKGYNRIWPDDLRLQAKVNIIRETAASANLPLVDTYKHWQDAAAAGTLDPHTLFTDEVHTNAAGHRLVYEELLPLFQCPIA
ncbi:MAG: SGNH/GDSL hydrolase family protein [Verrucomicrobiota bacterium]|nr:SGNH/GDSL hydrolase family protein [Verrucomicrobiota bacterium]